MATKLKSPIQVSLDGVMMLRYTAIRTLIAQEQKWLYNNDPVYKARIVANAKKAYLKLKKDPARFFKSQGYHLKMLKSHSEAIDNLSNIERTPHIHLTVDCLKVKIGHKEIDNGN